MKLGVIIILLAVLITDPARIGKINRVKEDARKAYIAGDYNQAIEHYKYLTDSLQVNDDEVLLNLANAYYQLKDNDNASGHYQSLTQSSKNSIRSKAHQQLGVIANQSEKFDEALSHFKEAIKADPANEDARYNYEMLKRKLDEKKKQEEQQQNQDQQQQEKDQQKKDQEKKDNEKKEQDKKDSEKKDQDQKNNQDKSDQEKQDQQKEQQQDQDKKEEQNEKENKPSSQKLEQMKISEEKAKMILEAMKNQEIQYLQQNKRKATKPKDKNKPDW